MMGLWFFLMERFLNDCCSTKSPFQRGKRDETNLLEICSFLWSLQDRNTSALVLLRTSILWLAFRGDLLSNFLVTSVSVGALLATQSPGKYVSRVFPISLEIPVWIRRHFHDDNGVLYMNNTLDTFDPTGTLWIWPLWSFYAITALNLN